MASQAAGMYVPGDVIDGRFEVVQILGGGGFATVYKVFDALEKEFWALKLFRETSAEAALLREISVLRKIQHPNILHVVWPDRTPDGRWYLLTEYLEGRSLDHFARRDPPLEDRIIASLGEELLSALDAMHEKGFIHRDIKPANLMLTNGRLKIVDFNIASRVGDPVQTFSGTAAYMPPDVDIREWKPEIDLFAAGVTLYELLCGELPFALDAARGDDPLDPRGRRADLPDAVAETLLRACAIDSEERFLSAEEMADSWRACSELLLTGSEARTLRPRERLHDVEPGGCDLIGVWPGELEQLSHAGAGWPAVLSCDENRKVWATFGGNQDLRGESSLMDVCVDVVLREKGSGGRFQIDDTGVFVWSLGRQVVRFRLEERRA